MSNKALSDIFHRWINRSSRHQADRGLARNRTRLRLEEVESRLAPATLPSPSVASPVPLLSGFSPQAVVNPNNPLQIVAVAASGNQILGEYSLDGGASWLGFTAARMTNRVTDVLLTNAADPNTITSTSISAYTVMSSPAIAFAPNGNVFVTFLETNNDMTSGAVGVTSFHFSQTSGVTPLYPVIGDATTPQITQLYQWVNQNPAYNPTIAVNTNATIDPVTGVPLPTDSMLGPSPSTNTKAVYVAWNTSATAPNTPSVTPGVPGTNNGFQGTTILAAASDDEAVTFTSPVIIPRGGYYGTGAAAPQILFTPNTTNPNTLQTNPAGNPPTAPGSLSFVWQTSGGSGITQNTSLPDGGSLTQQAGAGADYTAAGGTINQSATVNNTNTPTPTTFTQTISIPSDYASISPSDLVTDLTVSLAIVHQAIGDLRIELIAPNGQTITLVRNNVNADGSQNNSGVSYQTIGLPGKQNLGATFAGSYTNFPRNWFAKTAGGTGAVFDDNAALFINDTAAVSPYIGSYKPEGATLRSLYSGMTAATASGTWQLRITDFANHGTSPTPFQQLVNWNLHFSFFIQNQPATVAGGVVVPNPGFAVTANSTTGVVTHGTQTVAQIFSPGATSGPVSTVTPVPGNANQTYTTTGPVSPTLGIGPGVSVAYDTGLGSRSPYSGRKYMVYTYRAAGPVGSTNTDIGLVYSDDNGRTWHGALDAFGNPIPIRVNDDSITDNVTEGIRSQFMPTVAVDPVTGTVVVMWYDARNDASNARAATYIATSIDGGQTFSVNTYLNSPKQAIDSITGETVTLEPIPSTLVNSNLFQFGIRQSLIAYNGKVVTLWTGNSPYADENGVQHSNNSNGVEVYTNIVTFATGPRVVSGDSGAITAQAVITDGFGNPTSVTNSNNVTFSTYNDTFAPDGTRQLTGFRVVFDRPVAISSFTASQIQVYYQNPTTGQMVLIPVSSPIPIYPVGLSAAGVYISPTGDRVDYFPAGSTNAFFIPFQTAQSAVGTYSYSIGPSGTPANSVSITDQIESSLPTWDATNLPVSVPAFNSATSTPSTVTSSQTVSGVDPGTTLGNVAVTVNLTALTDNLGNSLSASDLTLTLIGPDGTRVVLADHIFASSSAGRPQGFYLTTFDNTATTTIGGVPPFTGRFRPDSYDPLNPNTSGLAAFIVNGTPINGTWQLEVSNDSGQTGVLTGWSLILSDDLGNLIRKNKSGNAMDQNADGVGGELNASGSVQADTFTNPNSTSGIPFTQPYATTTLPLIIPGPQVVNSSVVVDPVSGQQASTTSQPVSVSSVSTTTGGSDVTVTLNRPVDPGSFSPSAILGAFGPTGNVAVTSVTPLYTSIAPVLLTGTASITVTFLTEPTSFDTSNILSVNGPAGVIDPGTLFVLPTTDPKTYEIIFSTPLTAGGKYTFQFSKNLFVANHGLNPGTPTDTYAVTLATPVVSAVSPTLTAGTTTYTVTFTTAPTSFSASNITSIKDPFGNPISGPFSVSPLSATTFQITFPALATTGKYTFAFDNTTPPVANTYTFNISPTIRPTDGLVLNGSANALTVTFDRDIDASSFTPGNVLSLSSSTGGSISGPFTVTPVGTPSGNGGYRTFRIGFPTQVVNGSYAIQLGPNPNQPNPTLASIRSVAGDAVDTNQNAGLAKLRGIDPNSTVTTRTYSTPSAPGVVIPASSTTSLPITVPDSFIIQPGQSAAQQLQVLFNISFPYDPDVSINLVAPDGTAVRLFTGSGQQGLPNQANFQNTLLLDTPTTASGVTVTPISSAAAPYNPQAGAFNPQFPLSSLAGKNAKGTWLLQVINNGTRTGTLTNWSLTLPATVPGTGLGEAVADRITLPFRIFTQDPSNSTSQNVWTSLGGGSANSGQNAGQVSSVTVDPSDPSGNTVYAAGASGGVWKTTDFLTTNPSGPHWIPLTDFGPTTSLNIGSIAVFPKNNDPNQTVVLVGTGQGNTGSFGSGAGVGNPSGQSNGAGTPGVGFLLSTDGGKTWQILDSTVNVDSSGNVLPIQDAGRDHRFNGASVFKVLIDPSPSPSGQLIFYAAVSPSASGGSTAGGVWRSNDTGKTWTLVQAGQATDIVLAAGSAGTGTNKNLQILYAGFSGNGAVRGVYFTSSATTAASMVKVDGGQGNPLFLTNDTGFFTPIPIGNPNGGPGGLANIGRITLAAPALSSSPLENAFYQGWLYALVTYTNRNSSGSLYGLFMTKDYGRNWVEVQMPAFTATPNSNSPFQAGLYGTNNYSSNWNFTTATDQNSFSEGNNAVSLVTDPQNPNVVYIGGSNIINYTTGIDPANQGGFLRVDVTKIQDSQALVAYNNSLPGGITPQFTANTGAVVISNNPPGAGPGGLYGLVPTTFGSPLSPTRNTGYLNLFRDPANPFLANSTLLFTNVASFQNNGYGAVVQPFLGAELGSNIHSIVTYVDPVTHQTRLVIGDDMGISTVLDDGTGQIVSQPGFTSNPTKSRNGDLQIAQFYSGGVQPSQLAADIAGALIYGMSNNNGFPTSSSDILQTGNTNWTTGDGYTVANGSGNGVATDSTGSGTAYQFRFPSSPGTDGTTSTYLPTDFFRVITDTANNPAGVSRTNGLLQSGDIPQLPQQTANLRGGQWASDYGSTFAVNPLTPNGILISANDSNNGTGRVFRTTNQGVDWFPVGEPGTPSAFGTSGPTLDNTYAAAVSFGAPSISDQQTGTLSNFLYVGSSGGRVFVTNKGGAPWINITGPVGGTFGSNGSLDGSPVMAISPNPRPGATDVFVVTQKGVYYKADAFDTSTGWVNVTGNLLSLQNNLFGNANNPQLTAQFLTALAVDWRYEVPVNPGDPNTATFPILYVGGSAGVYRSLDFGTTWTYFPQGTTYTDSAGNTVTTPDGGYLPNVMVTKLSLALGNIDPATGLPQQSGGPNLLVATTYGRGTFGIRLGDALPQYNAQFQSGPRVTQVINPNPTGGPSTALKVQFSGSVDPSTFTPDTVRLTDPNGNSVAITSITGIPNLDSQGADKQDLYQINFAPQSAVGSYTLTIGYNPNGGNVPTITDLAGNRMNQNNTAPNGQASVDQYTSTFTLNGVTNSRLFVSSFPATAIAGTPVSVTIEAHDANDAVLTNVSGTVTLAPTDGSFAPFTVQLTNGVATFNISYPKAGLETVNATFSGGVTLNATSWTTNVAAAHATHFTLDPTTSIVSSSGAVSFTITARDDNGNVDTTYGQTVAIASTGAGANLPGLVTLVNGVGTFTGTFSTSGTVTVKVTGPNVGNPSGNALTSNTATVSVNPGPATQLVVTLPSGPLVAGTSTTVTVQALDANGNLANFNGSLAVSSTDPAFASSGNLTFVNGTASFTVTFNTPGTQRVTVTAGAISGTSNVITITAIPPLPTPTDKLPTTYAVGTGVDGSPSLNVYNADGSLRFSTIPFPAGFNGLVDATSIGFTGGLRVAVGDVTGDSVPDYVVGTGPSITASVVVIDGQSGQTVFSYQPFDTFKGGVFVAVGDIENRGVDDIIITPDQGGGPRVVILHGGNFSKMADFFGIADPGFRGGARAAAGDINADGFADLIVSAGFGGGPRISVYDGAALSQGRLFHPTGDFFAFPDALRNGTYVSVGDVNGDGYGDIVIGAGPGGGPQVEIVSGYTLLTGGTVAAMNNLIANFFAGDPNNRGGVRVTTKNLDGDRNAELITGAGEGGGSGVTVYRGSSLASGAADALYSFDALPGYLGGVYVG